MLFLAPVSLVYSLVLWHSVIVFPERCFFGFCYCAIIGDFSVKVEQICEVWRWKVLTWLKLLLWKKLFSAAGETTSPKLYGQMFHCCSLGLYWTQLRPETFIWLWLFKNLLDLWDLIWSTWDLTGFRLCCAGTGDYLQGLNIGQDLRPDLKWILFKRTWDLSSKQPRNFTQRLNFTFIWEDLDWRTSETDLMWPL